jgi:hypothetical protein
MIKIRIGILLCLGSLSIMAQDKPKTGMPAYFRKEEIIDNGKRYRIHNSYLSVGPGFLASSIRSSVQKSLGLDYQFPIRRMHFQAGALMSGEGFSSNNNVQAHVCYGFRKENRRNNFAAYIGPSFYTGVEGDASALPSFYQGVGLYGSAQVVTKFAYDIGLGLELFGEVSQKQNILGLRLIAFFSGAYRGPKRNFNANVRAENSK